MPVLPPYGRLWARVYLTVATMGMNLLNVFLLSIVTS